MMQRIFGLAWIVVQFVLWFPAANAKTVHYELVATKGSVNLSGKKSVDFALLINGRIPAPTLEFTEGDDAEILVKNGLSDDEISLHWHGLLLPPLMDGVPYVNTPPIRPGEAFTFKFKLRQHGTYWYHSHTGVQEQKGVYGALVVHPKKEKIRVDREFVAVLSDWTDENPDQVLRNLKKDGEYYLYKKNTLRSWLGAIRAGGLGTFLGNEWTRMGGMDLSDVGYDAFLINGRKDSQLTEARAGEKVRIRLINAAASTYFYVALGRAPMNVISSDGLDIVPTLAKEILIAPAETYDVLFTVSDHESHELKATAQDGTGSASAWIGSGEKVGAPVRPAPDLYASMNHGAMDMGQSMNHGAMGGAAMDDAAMSGSAMNHGNHAGVPGADMSHADSAPRSGQQKHEGHGGVSTPSLNQSQSRAHGVSPQRAVETLTVDQIRSPQKTLLSAKGKFHEVRLALDGDMNRYIWLINGKAIHEDYSLAIQEGEVVRFTFVNETMMHHPFHLHGHFYRVLNDGGEYSPLKHTVDVPPMGTRTIEFIANEPGDWMLHCHLLYHLKTGMARVVHYSGFTPAVEITGYQKLDPHLHDHWYGYGTLEAATNHGEAFYRLSQTWNQFEARIETRNTAGKNLSFRDPWEVEGDLFYRRWFGRNLTLVGGVTSFNESVRATAGVSYRLPFLIETQALIDHRGQFRVDVAKRFQWTSSILSNVDLTWRPGQGGGITEDLEFEATLMYAPSWSWAAGLMLTERAFGAGLEIQF